MASNNGVFPDLTIELGPSTTRSTSTTTASPLAQTVDNALREVLAWRPRSGDAKGFVAALNQAFTGNEVDGHTEFVWTPRSYAVQADLGAVTGAQASIYARAKAAIDQSVPLLEGLFSLRADADREDTDANRALVRTKLLELVNELGQVGGPRVQRVDDLFNSLLGADLQQEDPAAAGGLLGDLRDNFGLERRRINTIDEEQNLTNYLIIVDHVLCLRRSWLTQKNFFDTVGTDVFIGTQFVLISRALGVVAESVQELYFVLDSVFLGAAERQVIRLTSGLTIAELLGWVDRFATEEAPQIIRGSGKDGVIALRPTLTELVRLVDDARKQSEQQAAQQSIGAAGRQLAVARRASVNGATDPLQDGFGHPRTQAALRELTRHLTTTLELIDRIKREPPPTLKEIRLFDLINASGQNNRLLRLPPDSLNGLPVNDQSVLRLVIAGEDFQEGAAVEARQVDNATGNTLDVEPGSVSFMDTRFILALFDLNQLGNGFWDVAVINPDDQRADKANVFRLDAIGGQQPLPPPSLARLDPPTGGQGEKNKTVIIHGAGFQPPVTSDFGSGIVSDTGFVSPTRLIAVLNIDDDAVPGARTVTVTNQDGQKAAKVGGFTVEEVSTEPVTVERIELLDRDDQVTDTWHGHGEHHLQAGEGDHVVAIRVTFADAVEPASITPPTHEHDSVKPSFLVVYDMHEATVTVPGKIVTNPQQPHVVRFEATSDQFASGFPVGDYAMTLHGEQTTGQNGIITDADGTPIDGDADGRAGGNFRFTVAIAQDGRIR